MFTSSDWAIKGRNHIGDALIHSYVELHDAGYRKRAEKDGGTLEFYAIAVTIACHKSLFQIWVCSWEDRQRMWTPRTTKSRDSTAFLFHQGPTSGDFPRLQCNSVPTYLTLSLSIGPSVRNLLLSVHVCVTSRSKFFFFGVIVEVWVIYRKVRPEFHPGPRRPHCEAWNRANRLLQDHQRALV